MSHKIILGLDPGLATTGFGLIKTDGSNHILLDYGCIKTLPTTDNAIRLNQIEKDLSSLIKEYKPDSIAIETLFFNKNVKTGIKVAQARGVILSTISKHGYIPHEYNPLQIKSSIAGHGKATKQEIQKMVRYFLNINFIPKPDDSADALAIAICHSTMQRLA